MVSNRLPFAWNQATESFVRGSGGLVSALKGIQFPEKWTWVGAENLDQTPEDKSFPEDPNFNCMSVKIDNHLLEKFYDGMCNQVLWPLFHYEGNLTTFDNELWSAYQKVNERFADEIIKHAKDGDQVWIHDFHFFLLPKLLRERNPHLQIGFFLHIPFPVNEIFRQLPVREEILEGILGADLIGFHEYSYLRHFTVTLKGLLGFDSSFFKVDLQDRSLALGVYPVSVDIKRFQEKAQSPEVVGRLRELQKSIPEPFLVLGVDRLDYAKGLELKLKAFHTALRRYPELQGKMALLQVAVPSRTNVPAYQNLKRDIDQLVGEVNGEFGRADYTPVRYMFRSISEIELLALYQRAEALLVTSKRDGMNLVAIEYLLARNENSHGILLLSEFAGAASSLSSAVFINPWDTDATALELKNAFTMSQKDRQERFVRLRQRIHGYSSKEWAKSFLQDLQKTSSREERMQNTELIEPLTKGLSDHLKTRVQSAKRLLLFLDFDGTLVPLIEKPDESRLSGETLHSFRAWMESLPRVEWIIISGRRKDFLDRTFSELASFHLAAEHGAFVREKNSKTWKSLITSDIQQWKREAERVMLDYSQRVPMSFVELKEASICWHYRSSPVDFAEFQALKLSEELEVCLANSPSSIMHGDKIVEARAVECNKGDFLRWFLRENPLEEGDLVVAVGDDKTDEDLFRAVGSRGLSVKIGKGRTYARYRVSTQEEVLSLLSQLCAAKSHESIRS